MGAFWHDWLLVFTLASWARASWTMIPTTKTLSTRTNPFWNGTYRTEVVIRVFRRRVRQQGVQTTSTTGRIHCRTRLLPCWVSSARNRPEGLKFWLFVQQEIAVALISAPIFCVQLIFFKAPCTEDGRMTYRHWLCQSLGFGLQMTISCLEWVFHKLTVLSQEATLVIVGFALSYLGSCWSLQLQFMTTKVDKPTCVSWALVCTQI